MKLVGVDVLSKYNSEAARQGGDHAPFQGESFSKSIIELKQSGTVKPVPLSHYRF